MILLLEKPPEASNFNSVQHAAATGLFSNNRKQRESVDFNKALNLVRDQEVDGSNPFAPTNSIPLNQQLSYALDCEALPI